jgi:hypothetical protein
LRFAGLYESFVKLISPKITNKKVGHIINAFSFVMCPIFVFKEDLSMKEFKTEGRVAATSF